MEVRATLFLVLLVRLSYAALGTPPVPISSQNTLLGRNDTLTLYVPLNQVKDAAHTPDKLVLFLNGRMIKALPTRVDPSRDRVAFDLTRNDSNKKEWQALLGRPSMNLTLLWHAQIGYEDIGPISTQAPFAYMAIRPWAFWTMLLATALLVWGLWHLGRSSAIMKDGKGYYSLGRVQMAFWFVLVVTAFSYIWMLTADRGVVIPATVLGLIGISAGTGLAAQLVDQSKETQRDQRRTALRAEQANLQAAVATLGTRIGAATSPTESTALQAEQAIAAARLLVIGGELGAMAATEPSQGFFRDMVSDGTDVSFHRFQIAVWTLVLGIVFVYSVWDELNMPEFSETLLALMGISSGTYIGFKFPEKTT